MAKAKDDKTSGSSPGATAPSAGGGAFPPTHASAIRGILSPDPQLRQESRTLLAEAYWKPAYKYLRLRWRMPATEAEDVTQEFFLRCFDLDTFAAYDPQRGRFRTFLRVCLDRFVADRHRRRTAAKRGGGLPPVDFAAAEHELASVSDAGSDPELMFEREWVRHVMSLAVDRLRTELTSRGKQQHLRIFELFHLDDVAEPPSYADAAAMLGISVSDVTNRLSYARREFRYAALGILRQITVDEDEFKAEMVALFGGDVEERSSTRGRRS
jgi:RNA polymerase sigma factor (sigma-70 family)